MCHEHPENNMDGSVKSTDSKLDEELFSCKNNCNICQLLYISGGC